MSPASTPASPPPDLQREVIDMFAKLLGVSDSMVAPESSFFGLGGSSLQAVALAAMLNARFGVELTAAEIVDHPSASRISAHVAALRERAAELGEEEGLL